MPYIATSRRMELDNGNPDHAPISVGDLNYMVTSLVDDWLNNAPKNYERYNAAIGVLESAKLELYRRLVAPYENRKIVENGDVYTDAEAVVPVATRGVRVPVVPVELLPANKSREA